MGTAAGQGTSFAIDREQVAGLLGFTGIIPNSLDAVASRDYVVHVLAGMGMFGSTLTRLAVDLQMWSSQAYGFLDWPDDLVSTSSIMPQKRNAFVWENIRGMAAHANGALIAALTSLKNTSFTNTVEVSSEATAHLWPALNQTREAARLTALLIERMVVDAPAMKSAFHAGDITMTALADYLVSAHSLPFRTAHHVVSQLTKRKAGKNLGSEQVCLLLEELLAAECIPVGRLSASELSGVLDPEACVSRARFGGGPNPESVNAQLHEIGLSRREVERILILRRQRLEAADLELDVVSDAILKGVNL